MTQGFERLVREQSARCLPEFERVAIGIFLTGAHPFTEFWRTA